MFEASWTHISNPTFLLSHPRRWLTIGRLADTVCSRIGHPINVVGSPVLSTAGHKPPNFSISILLAHLVAALPFLCIT
jgi:hypothetical protein